MDVPTLEEAERVVGVAARLPIGTLTIKGSSRTSDSHAQVVNTPSQVAEAREAFADE